MTGDEMNSDARARETADLDWLAFQYIAGELTDEQTRAFEGRLASDQEACEAVAAAVELSEITALVEKCPAYRVTAKPTPHVPVTASSPLSWARSLAWMGCGAVACLLVVALAQRAGPPERLAENDLDQGPARQVADGSPELALVWAQARSDGAIEFSAEPADAVLPADALLQGESANEISTPSWMITAVAGLGGQIPDLE